MGSKAPPIPPDQRARPGDKPHIKGDHMDRHDMKTGDESRRPLNEREQGRQGNLHQNTRNTGYQQDR
jgi:hypothetical protein